MFRVRLHGLPEEIEKASKELKDTFRVLEESTNYVDRGNSLFVRRYLTATFKEKKEDNGES